VKGVESTDANHKQTLALKTTNISSFRLTRQFKGYHKLVIDGDSKFSHLEKIHIAKRGVTFTLDKKSKRWKVVNPSTIQ
jgi:hemin uptake protein HemP